jgi:hypothetical protein
VSQELLAQGGCVVGLRVPTGVVPCLPAARVYLNLWDRSWWLRGGAQIPSRSSTQTPGGRPAP